MAKIKNDAYKVTVAGVGYIGNINFKLKTNKVYIAWKSILHRCYNSKYQQYRFYGAKGVVVEEYLHSFENFYNHVKTLENYERWLISKDYHLDKDKFSTSCKIYSRDTISIIPYYENLDLAGKEKLPIVCFNLKKEFVKEYESIYQASKLTNNPASNIYKCLMKERNTCGKMYWCFKHEFNDSYEFRKNKPHIITVESKKKIPILQFDLMMNRLNNFDSLTEASNELKIPLSTISECINGKRNNINGFIFKKEIGGF